MLCVKHKLCSLSLLPLLFAILPCSPLLSFVVLSKYLCPVFIIIIKVYIDLFHEQTLFILVYRVLFLENPMSSPATAVAYREMCRIDKYTDIYLQEIRTRRQIHKCLFSPPGARMCKRVWIRDHGKVYHTRRRTYIEESPKMPLIPPRYKISQSPPKLVRSKTCPVVDAIERGPSPKPEKKEAARSHPVKFGIPFLTRSTEREERRDDRHRQRREERREERTARPFVVEAPPEEYRYRRESTRSRRRTRSDSPRRGRSPVSDRRSSLDSPSRRESRRPRETSPVTERTPLRRTNRVVEVHNYETPRSRSWSRTRNAEGHPEERRVRFANDDQVDQVSRGPNRSSSFEDTDYEYDIIKERPSRQHREKERHTRKPSPWPERPEKQKAGRNTTRNMPPPRIVQDGCQRVSSSTANNRDWDHPRNIEIRRPRSRGHARFRQSSLEPDSKVVCDADHWRYGGRWR